MKYSLPEVSEMFERLGVTRWDFMPPQDGKIKFFDKDDRKVGEGDYQIILSYGPGESYSMAWAISDFEPFPRVEKLNSDEEATVSPALEGDAYSKAIEIGEQVGADFVYKAMTIYVAVRDFKEIQGGEVVENMSQEERIQRMKEDQANQTAH